MASVRSRRSVRGVNYSLFNSMGKKFDSTDSGSESRSRTHIDMADSEYEEGQVEDSPFTVHHDGDDEFNTDSLLSDECEDEQQHGLDDTLTQPLEGQNPPRVGGEESILSVPDHELVQDEVWQQQQEILRANKEKREKVCVQLQRRHEVAEALLKEEEE